MYCKMEIIHFEKQGTKWVEINRVEQEIGFEVYKNILEAKTFFKSLGGYERHTKSYTPQGYLVTEVLSLSPNRKFKTLRHFYFN